MSQNVFNQCRTFSLTSSLNVEVNRVDGKQP